MNDSRKYLCFLAPAPLIFGIDLMTGGNVFPVGGFTEPIAVILGVSLAILALVMTILSRVCWAQLVASFLLMVTALLLAGWGVVVAMFSGFGDGASSGASFSAVAIYFVGGICCFTAAVFNLRHRLRNRRAFASDETVPPSVQAG